MKRALLLALVPVCFAHFAHAGEKEDGAAEEFDLAAGEEIFKKTCKNCHGPKAQGMASYPALADKDAEHLTTRLEQYRAGEKIGPNSILMFAHAKNLSDEDIVNIVGYVTTSFD